MRGRTSGKGWPSGTPRVWALLGRRTGDNLQVETMADALGWPCERKVLTWRERRRGWTIRYGRMGPSLAPLTDEARALIAPPWPDLVLSVGWRSAPVARWIGREGGPRLVHIGRPRAPLDGFDLVLTTPQYHLPETANVVQLDAPMTRLSAEVLAGAAEQWRDRLVHLPRPWIAVLIGGDAPPLRLTPDAAAELGAKANGLARQRGGSLLIATGPRTGHAATEAFLACVGVPAHSYLWGGGGENPYTGYLALADEIVVTSDSISMVHEASLTCKPIHLFDLPTGGAYWKRTLRWIDTRMHTGGGAVSHGYRNLVRQGWICPPRVPDAFHAELVRGGRAVRLGEAIGPATAVSVSAGIDRAVSTVRDLLGA
ncbi:MAG: mitochondrial fission ELM1 family protein [Alphaproteobacteria bacterium]